MCEPLGTLTRPPGATQEALKKRKTKRGTEAGPRATQDQQATHSSKTIRFGNFLKFLEFWNFWNFWNFGEFWGIFGILGFLEFLEFFENFRKKSEKIIKRIVFETNCFRAVCRLLVATFLGAPAEPRET